MSQPDPAHAGFAQLPVTVRVASGLASKDDVHVLTRVDAPQLLAAPAFLVLDMQQGRVCLSHADGTNAWVDLAQLILLLAREAGSSNPAASRLN